MDLTFSQSIIAADDHRFRVVVCGRKFGKTTTMSYELIGYAVRDDNQQVAYFASTYGEARDIIWQRLKRNAETIIVSANEQRLELVVRTIRGGTSVITLRGWESVETARGLEFDFIGLDEVQNYRNFFAMWQEVLRPTLSPRKGSAMFIGTAKGFNHFYDLFNLQDTDENYRSFRFSTYDNPFIDVEEIEEAKRQISPIRFNQEYMAEFTKMEGLVYADFYREKHLITDEEKEKILRRMPDLYAGVDFGFTNPLAVVILCKYDGIYYILNEWFKTQKTNAEMIEYVSTLNINAFYPDPAEPDRIEEMRRSGLRCMEVNKDIDKGIDSVRTLFREGKLKIWEGCKNTISELESYAYDSNKPDGKPIDEWNHAMDALRYVLFMLSSIGHKRTATVHYAQGMNPLPPVVRPEKPNESRATVHTPTNLNNKNNFIPKRKF